MNPPEATFALHERLAADTEAVGSLTLCRVLLMNDARWPWLILVPQRPGLTGLHQLPAAARTQLMEEIAAVSRLLEQRHRPDRINVGALGNLVPQLHVHVIARFRDDPAWPGPVWGHGTAQPYTAAERERVSAELRAALSAE